MAVIAGAAGVAIALGVSAPEVSPVAPGAADPATAPAVRVVDHGLHDHGGADGSRR